MDEDSVEDLVEDGGGQETPTSVRGSHGFQDGGGRTRKVMYLLHRCRLLHKCRYKRRLYKYQVHKLQHGK